MWTKPAACFSRREESTEQDGAISSIVQCKHFQHHHEHAEIGRSCGCITAFAVRRVWSVVRSAAALSLSKTQVPLYLLVVVAFIFYIEGVARSLTL